MSAILGNKAELARQDNAIRQALDSRRAALRMNKELFAHRIGMSEDTFTRRYKKPEDFTLKELRKLCGVMGWSADTIKEVLFG